MDTTTVTIRPAGAITSVLPATTRVRSSGTLLHATKLPLVKWFWAIYWVASDKGSISALRLAKLIGVTWRSAFRMLRKLRTAMGHRDTLYRLTQIIEFDDAFIGGKRPGKRGRGQDLGVDRL